MGAHLCNIRRVGNDGGVETYCRASLQITNKRFDYTQHNRRNPTSPEGTTALRQGCEPLYDGYVEDGSLGEATQHPFSKKIA